MRGFVYQHQQEVQSALAVTRFAQRARSMIGRAGSKGQPRSRQRAECRKPRAETMAECQPWRMKPTMPTKGTHQLRPLETQLSSQRGRIPPTVSLRHHDDGRRLTVRGMRQRQGDGASIAVKTGRCQQTKWKRSGKDGCGRSRDHAKSQEWRR